MEIIVTVKVHNTNGHLEDDEEYFFRRRQDAVDFIVKDYFGYAGILSDDELAEEIRECLKESGVYDAADVVYTLGTGILR